MREGETSLLKGADALIADVEAALADFVTQQDRTKKARVELVLDQCKARRGALRASLASERAALVSSDDGGADLVKAAQQLVQEAERASEMSVERPMEEERRRRLIGEDVQLEQPRRLQLHAPPELSAGRLVD